MNPPATRFANVRYPDIHFIRTKFDAYGNLWKTFHWFHDVSRFAYVCVSKSQEVDLLASFSNLRSLVEGPPVNDTDDISRLPPKTATGWSCFLLPWGRGGKVVDEGRCWKTSFSFGTPSQGAMQASSKCSSQFNTVAFRGNILKCRWTARSPSRLLRFESNSFPTTLCQHMNDSWNFYGSLRLLNGSG